MMRQLFAAAAIGAGGASAASDSMPRVALHTSSGVITVALDAAAAPKSVENFLTYARSGHYDGTVFHRVIPNFMIQGGGMTEDMQPRKTRPPIANESGNGLENARGTLAMARTNQPDSATSQFFINLKDNDFLNPGGVDPHGYAVFGKVTDGMKVVDDIAATPTGRRGGHADVPVKAITIERVEILDAAE